MNYKTDNAGLPPLVWQKLTPDNIPADDTEVFAIDEATGCRYACTSDGQGLFYCDQTGQKVNITHFIIISRP